MQYTLLHHDAVHFPATGSADGEALWLDAGEARDVTGFELKPEGFCRDEVCVLIPPGRETELKTEDGRRVNLTALARLLGEPIVRSPEHGVWAIGEAGIKRHERLVSLQAPDFTLP